MVSFEKCSQAHLMSSTLIEDKQQNTSREKKPLHVKIHTTTSESYLFSWFKVHISRTATTNYLLFTNYHIWWQTKKKVQQNNMYETWPVKFHLSSDTMEQNWVWCSVPLDISLNFFFSVVKWVTPDGKLFHIVHNSQLPSTRKWTKTLLTHAY